MRSTVSGRVRRATLGLVVAFALWASVTGGSAAQEAWPGTSWETATPSAAGMQRTILEQGVAYARQYSGSGMVVRGGRRVRFWGDQTRSRNLLSATKTIGGVMLGLAIGDGRADLGDAVQPVIPDFAVPPIPPGNDAASLLPGVTLGQLATHTAGFDKTGGYGGLRDAPGTAWFYSDGSANWVADYLTMRFGQDLDAVLRARVLDPLQIPVTGIVWRRNAYRPRTLGSIERRELGSGISANVDALARLGLLLLRDGRWRDQRLLPAGFVGTSLGKPWREAGTLERSGEGVDPEAPRHYGLLTWNNADGWLQGVPTDAFWAWGLNEQLMVVVPSLDLVVVRTGSRMGSTSFGQIDRLAPFLGPIARSIQRANLAPVVSAGPDAARLGAGTVVLEGTAQEDGLPGTTRMAVAWQQVDGPAPATIRHPGRLTTAVDLPAPGTYEFELAVVDGSLAGSDRVLVTID